MNRNIEKSKEQKMPMVTVVMPVYRVEKYVAKAIESIQAQRNSDGTLFSDWELIAVDDGSPDQSGRICDAYAEKDSRIRVIHQENAGAPKARNRAIDLAGGKYLFFLDSDDWCEPTMLADLSELAEKTDAELVVSGFYIDTYYNDNEYITSNFIPKAGIYSTQQTFREQAYALFDKNMFYPPWNKLYRREYICSNGLYFPETFWDDFPFVLSVIRDISRVTVTERQYYHFLRARAESETARFVPRMYEKREEENQWMIELYQYWGLWERTENREMVNRRYLDRLIGCFENLTNPQCTLPMTEKRKQVREMLVKPTVTEALSCVQPRSLYAKLMYLPLRLKSTNLMLLEASVITYVKRHHGRLFAKLKAGR